jgi:hypothetical protein
MSRVAGSGKEAQQGRRRPAHQRRNHHCNRSRRPASLRFGLALLGQISHNRIARPRPTEMPAAQVQVTVVGVNRRPDKGLWSRASAVVDLTNQAWNARQRRLYRSESLGFASGQTPARRGTP